MGRCPLTCNMPAPLNGLLLWKAKNHSGSSQSSFSFLYFALSCPFSPAQLSSSCSHSAGEQQTLPSLCFRTVFALRPYAQRTPTAWAELPFLDPFSNTACLLAQGATSWCLRRGSAKHGWGGGASASGSLGSKRRDPEVLLTCNPFTHAQLSS